MKFLDKSFLFLISVIVMLFFLFRLPNLTLQPIFADEAIYIRWAQVMRSEPTLRFLPMSDGKTPLYMWMMIPVFKVVPDPLLAGRLLSVFSGFLTFLGILMICYKFYDKNTILYATLLTALTPYLVFFDRLALADSLLAAFTVWTVFLGLLVVNNPRLDLAMFLGYTLGGGIITKTPGIFNFVLLPILIFSYSKLSQLRGRKLVNITVLFIVALAIGMVIYNMLRLGPGFLNLSSRNQDYIRSPLELLKNPLDPLIPFSKDFFQDLVSYMGIPFLLLFICTLIYSVIKFNRLNLILMTWSIIPILTQLMLLQVFTARYVFFSIPLLLIPVASFLSFLTYYNNKIVKIFLVIFVISWPLYFNINLLINPEKVPLPVSERRGYLEDWTAGYGLREIAEYLNKESKNKKIVIATEGYFGTLPDGLQIYFDKNPNVVIFGDAATVSARILEAANDNDAYFVANKSRYSNFTQNADLIKEYKKAIPISDIPQDSMLIFKIKNPSQPVRNVNN